MDCNRAFLENRRHKKKTAFSLPAALFLTIAVFLFLIPITPTFSGLCLGATNTERSDDFSAISMTSDRGWSISLLGRFSKNEALGIEEYSSSFESALTCRITDERFLVINLSTSKNDTVFPDGIISSRIRHIGLYMGSCHQKGLVYYEGAIGYGEMMETVEEKNERISAYKANGTLFLRGKAGLIVDPVMLFVEISHSKVLNMRALFDQDGQYTLQPRENETTISLGLDFAINDKIGTALSFTMDPYLRSTNLTIFYSPNMKVTWEAGIILPASDLFKSPSIMLGVTYVP